MTGWVDTLLDRVTMYWLMLQYLAALLAAGFVLGFFHLAPQEPTALAFSAVLIGAGCWLTGRVFALVFAVPANAESTLITALILILIFDPVTAADLRGVAAVLLAAVWAIASKFMLAVGRKHVFNPAAFGAALAAFLLGEPATWWVGGNLALLPLVLAGGVLVVRKLRCFGMVLSFVAGALMTVAATTPPGSSGMAFRETLLHSPLFVLGFVMLTDPLTAPTARWARMLFGLVVGILSAPNVRIGGFYFTPELALLVGNVVAFLVGPRGRLLLTLERIERAAADTYDFVLRPNRRLAYQAGQYLEWTLSTPRSDSRGNRRYFTLASAPTEEKVRLGVKFYDEPSAFKSALAAMRPGDTILATQLAGSFTLPRDRRRKLAFLAGGIGVTPFRSMLLYLIDRQEERDVVMLYGNETQADIAYREVLEAAERLLGVRTVHAVRKGAREGQHRGFIDAKLVREAIPDFRERLFYISGPQAMVRNTRAMLRKLGVRRGDIKVDFFPGFA